MSFRVLIIYSSSHGQTHKIAEAIADRLRERGAHVDTHDVHAAPLPLPDSYDVVGLGSRIKYGRHDPAIHRYVDQHFSAILTRQNFFFSVSLAASDKPHLRDPANYISDTILATAWRPDLTAAFAGALPYRRYNWILRLLMKLRSSRHGNPRDTSRDHELTDWGAVRQFADTIAGWAGRPRRPERALGARLRPST